MGYWYKLDNAAKLFPSVTNAKNSSVFRISAVLMEPVDRENLQKAVDRIFDRYPMLFVRMRQGVFWNYLDNNHEKFVVQEEQDSPCAAIDPYQNNGYFLRLLYFGNRVSVEIFHSLTDGSGAVDFLKSVLYYYFSFCGHEIDSEGKVLLSDGYVPPDNLEDSFSAYYKDIKADSRETAESYHIIGTAFERSGTNVTTGVLRASELNKTAKANGATITSYLAAVMIYSIYNTRQNYDGKMAPIVVAVPVNLRKAFPSTTLRNFFGVVNIGMHVVKETTFDEIVATVTAQLKEKTTREALQEIISKNVALEKNLPARMVPLGAKKPFVSAGFHLMGESRKSISLSNVGNLSLPQGMTVLIEHMEVILYPTRKSPINVAICSVNDKLTINFARSIGERDLLLYFFRFLTQHEGLEIALYSNDWGEKS